jgi:Zn-dependent protease with chaperone function
MAKRSAGRRRFPSEHPRPMDFFRHQESALLRTRCLVLVLLLEILLMIGLAVGSAFLVLLLFNLDSPDPIPALLNWRLVAFAGGWMTVIVLAAIGYKWMLIGEGGKPVAEALGGVRVPPNSRKPEERRLLNVVREMAIAAGMPVPSVYLLERESGINAFAAGNSPADAVIAVTRGCLEQLNRDQLQGVVAHEFSHILNGDMRLNLRLIALLHGVLFIDSCGEFLSFDCFDGPLSPDSWRGNMKGPLALIHLVGLCLSFVGGLGTLFGEMIKAAINRQREFLADASAIRLTRNAAGLAGAPKTIGGFEQGSAIRSRGAGEVSHLFFGEAGGGFSLFRTHPPLAERIFRLDPAWDGKFPPIEQVPDGTDADGRRSPVASAVLPGAVAAMAGVESRKTPSTGEIPETLRRSIEEPFGALCLFYALLLDSREAVRERQLRMMEEAAAPGSGRTSLEFFTELAAIDPVWRIILLDMALPALKSLSIRQFLSLKNVLRRLIDADNGTDLFEWCLFQRVDHYLGAEFGGKSPSRPRFKNISQVREPFMAVLTTLVYHCPIGQQSRERLFSRGMTCAGLYDGPPMPEKECTMGTFISGIEALACCTPLLKARILTSLVQVVKFDGVIAPMERELVTAIAAAMDSPIPRLLDL